MGIGSRAGGVGMGGSGTVVGNQTPGDNIATPSDCVDTRTFVELFDGATWDAWRSTLVQGAADVTERLMPAAEDNTNSVYWVQLRALATATGAWTNDAPTALIGTAGRSIKATAGRLRSIRVTNTGANPWYVQVHNKASAPVNADNSIDRKIVPAGSTVELGYDPEGIALSLGVAVAISTTPIALTLIAANEAAITTMYA